MDNAFFIEQSISFEIIKFLKKKKKKEITGKVRLKIKYVILLGDSSQADKALFLHCLTFIEFLGHLKGKKSMLRVNGHMQSVE